MINWLPYLTVWIIKLLYIATEIISQLNLSGFYQSLLNEISHIPKFQLRQLKTKLRDACEKYCKKIYHINTVKS